MSQQIRKAVIPVAGLGTRYLPITKSVPKELLPILDKPAIQYVVEEAVASGLTRIILVTAHGKEAIQSYLTRAPEYEKRLEEAGKLCLLGGLNALLDQFELETVLQSEPRGLGHAALCAKKLVGDEPFVLLLPDVIIESDPPCSGQLISVYERMGRGVIYTAHTPREQLGSYGVLDVENSVGPLHKLKGLVEKPDPKSAPSDLTVVGRYLLPPSIFKIIEDIKPGAIGEIQLTDGLTELARTEGLYALEHEARVFDIGDRRGYLQACMYYGAKGGWLPS